MDQIGRYRIIKEVGRGAMGVVYEALDPAIGRTVAIKTIHLTDVDNPEDSQRLRDRLFREARSAGNLKNPGIVTIYDMAEQDNMAYIAMEFVNGFSLEKILASKEPIERDRLLHILRQTGAALDYAHQKGIIHRDIKPANILIDEAGDIKITDFGIAKITSSEHMTLTGVIVGTPNYISPEQVQGLAIDGRADQFSLAVIAYEMLTGERPFVGENLTTVVYKIVAEEPPPLARLNPTLGTQIEAVIRKGLAKKPDGRYALCGEFVNSLEEACAATEGWRVMGSGVSLSLPTLVEEPRRHAVRESDAPHRAPKLLPALAAVAVALGLIGLIAWQAGIRPGPPPPAAPAETAPTNTPQDQKPSPMDPPPAKAPEASADSKPVETKPVETKPAETKPVETKPVETQPAVPVLLPRAATGPQEISVPSDPPGAAAVLDNRPETACQTPCTLLARPGRHTISLTMPGFQQEYREFQVSGQSVSLPPIILRANGGTLMLATTPDGASIVVDGKPMTRKTPAQLNLAPGVHTVTVEKDGQRGTEQVTIRDGDTKHLRITLSQ